MQQKTKRYRGQRGPQKAPTKLQITIRLSADVVEWYRSSGEGWQGRLNDDLLRLKLTEQARTKRIVARTGAR